MENNIYNIFGSAAQLHGTNKAIVGKKDTLTYQEMKYAIQAKADELITSGIERGDKILVFIPMSTELYVFLLATFKIGAVAVFLDEWANKKRLMDCLQKVPCKGFAGGRKAQVLRFFYKPLRSIPTVLSPKINRVKCNIKPAVKVDQDETALITFTTGSTSSPKAANRTHQFLTAQYNTLKDELKTKVTDIDFIGLPIVVLCNLGTGATSVLPNYSLKKLDKINPEKVSQLFKNYGVNRIVNSPSFFKLFGQTKNLSLSNIDTIFTGGASVFPNDIPLFKNSFNKAKINILYGSTEAEPISHINGDELFNRKDEILLHGLPVGKLSPDVSLKIIKQTDKEMLNATDLNQLLVGEGEIGEILVSGNHVLKEYLNSEIDTKKNKIKEGATIWHRTGDAGKLLNNELFLQGRINQLFTIDNELISPFIYEYLFDNNPRIVKGTILKKDEQVIAFIQPKEVVDNDSLKKEILNNHSKIKAVHVIKQIPLDPRHNAKIDYARLLKME